jgi:hypothetical protein
VFLLLLLARIAPLALRFLFSTALGFKEKHLLLDCSFVHQLRRQ